MGFSVHSAYSRGRRPGRRHTNRGQGPGVRAATQLLQACENEARAGCAPGCEGDGTAVSHWFFHGEFFERLAPRADGCGRTASERRIATQARRMRGRTLVIDEIGIPQIRPVCFSSLVMAERPGRAPGGRIDPAWA